MKPMIGDKKLTPAERNKRWREKHPDRAKASVKNWQDRNRETVRKWCRDFSEKIRLECFALFGSVCCRCDFSDTRALQLDHINGAEEPAGHKMRGGRYLYLALIKGERELEDFQLLCANCNSIKRFENGEHKNYKKLKKEQAAD